MRRYFGILGISALMAISSPGRVLSTEFVIPLPGLTGTYGDFTPTRTTTFNVNLGVRTIELAKLRIVGTQPVPSFTNCGYNGAIVSASIPAATGSWVVGKFYMDLRLFDITANLVSSDDATWDFLMDGDLLHGEATVSLTAVPRPLPDGCRYSHGSWPTEPDVSYVAIVLVLSSTVPVEHQTWGAIKALYR